MADPKFAALVATAKITVAAQIADAKSTVANAKVNRAAMLVKLGLCPKCQKRLRGDGDTRPPQGGWPPAVCPNC